MKPPPELERVLLGRKGRRSGEEIFFRCPFPDRHRNGDANPSAQYNTTKGVWRCNVCAGRGHWTELCELVGVAVPVEGGSRVVARYVYRDEKGSELRRKLRWEPGFDGGRKSFSWQKPDDKGGWTKSKGDGNPKVLYGSEKLPLARKSKQRVFVVEGEKDCDAAARFGLVAFCNPEGAAQANQRPKWKPEYSEQLKGLAVVVIADKDAAGRAHGEAVASSLVGAADSVRLCELPGDHVKDLSDWVAEREKESRSRDEIREALEELANGAEERAEESTPAAAPSQKETQATILIRLVQEAEAELFHTPDNECYATVSVAGHRETSLIRQSRFRRILLRAFYRQEGKPPGAQAVEDALRVLEARAQFDGPEHEVHSRVAGKRGAIYLDLGNEAWEAVEITASGWRVIADPPIKFRRAKGMLALPRPVRGGSVRELRPFLNVASEAEFVLGVAWAVGALRNRGPYPGLDYLGEQGSAKSTQARIYRNLIDPSTAALRTMPRSERDLMITATNGWVLAFDNLSSLPNWFSDALCRLSTGGGFSTRELYSNAEETIFSAMRPVILNGIEAVVIRQDLVDRCITLNPPPILDSDRRTEAELWTAFDEAHPRILGGLLDAVSCALANLPKTRLEARPRMADFATWIVAAEPALPWEPGAFMGAFTGNRAEAVEMAIEADDVALAVRTFVTRVGEWEGSVTGLLDALEQLVTDKVRRSKRWPKSPRALSGRLRRAASFLRTVGAEVDFEGREGGTGRRLLKLRRTAPPSTLTTLTTVTKGSEVPEDAPVEDVRDGATGSADEPTFTDPHEGEPLDPGAGEDAEGCEGRLHPRSNDTSSRTDDELVVR